jgi:hypothetical protein
MILLYEIFGGEKDGWSYCMKSLGERMTINLIVWNLWGRAGRLISLYAIFGGEKDGWSYCMKPLGERRTIDLIVWSLCGREGRFILLYEVFGGRDGRLILLYAIFGGEKDGWSYCMKPFGERRTIDLIVWSLWGREGRLILLYEVFGERRTIDLIVWSLWGREGRLIHPSPPTKTSYNTINRPSLPQRLHTIRAIVFLSPKDFIQ